jgi:hypothetical protein
LCVVRIVEHLCSCRQVIGEDHYSICEEDTGCFFGDHIAELGEEEYEERRISLPSGDERGREFGKIEVGLMENWRGWKLFQVFAS